jgi:hypothetical protein
VVQKNVVASGCEYSEFILTVCLGSETAQYEAYDSLEAQTESCGSSSA